jgi:RHS repeat-associated protein
MFVFCLPTVVLAHSQFVELMQVSGMTIFFFVANSGRLDERASSVLVERANIPLSCQVALVLSLRPGVCAADSGDTVLGEDVVGPKYPHTRMTRFSRLSRRQRRIQQVLLTLMAAVAIAISLVTAIPAAAATTAIPAKPSSVAKGKSVPVTPVVGHYQKPKPLPAWKPGAIVWPTGSATVSLTTPSGSPATTASGGSAPAVPAATHAVTSPVKAGNLPVWVKPAPPTKTPANASVPSIPTSVQVTASPRQVATAAGITGFIVSVGRADDAASSGRVSVTVGYGGYANAFGGDWSSRLRLVTMPACVLTTPQKPACRTTTDVPFTRDAKAQTLTTTVSLPGAAPASKTGSNPATPGLVLATESSAAGGGTGDYTATSLKPAGSWQAGGSSDAFSWSYPITVPPVPGGLEPTVQLSYNSQSVDGLTSTTNNQASWVGDGWSYEPGYVEQSFQSCEQNTAPLPKTGDNCWSSNDTLTLSLDGSTSTLIPAGTDGSNPLYRAQDDSNERIQQIGSPNQPGVTNTEYFKVTTDDGTQYFFGLNKLPGWATGDPITNSVWTEPVYAPISGQACYNATFANASCTQDYRWNLDYVVDPHGDAVSYYYATETNYYATNNSKTANASYVRGGHLTKILYGQRDQHVYDTQPAAQVVFNTTPRCLQQSGCDVSTVSSATASWPDVPGDLSCASGAACQAQSPSFWSEYELSSIQTTALIGANQSNVDLWNLAYQFPNTGDNTQPSLWLHTITHVGQDTTAGSNNSISLPNITFDGFAMDNRVNTTGAYAPITRYRLTQITTETAEQIDVGYTAPSCDINSPPNPSTNTSLCYPDYWTPIGSNAPIQDWFNQFVVANVTEQDPTGGSGDNDTITTTYLPQGNPAWHYNDNPLTPNNQRTWDQWRGYSGMIVETGKGDDPVTKTAYTYFQGMEGDTLPNGQTRHASVTDSRGDPAITDASQYSGMTYETTVYNGSSIVTDTIEDPWSSPATASQPLTGLPAAQAFLTGTADTRVYTPLANGTTQETETSNTHDSYGRVTQVNDQGDLSTTADDLCTTTTYADNTSAWILDLPAEESEVSVSCDTTPTYPTDAVSDTRTFYDGLTTFPETPTDDNATTVEKAVSYTGNAPNLVGTEATFDEYGRTLTATDGDGNTTTTAYTPATGAEPTGTSVTDPLKHTTKTTTDPARDLPLSSTDAAGLVTTEQYDALGRLTAVNKPGEPAPQPPNIKYSYTVSNTGPSVVDTYTLDDQSTYSVSETLYDSMLRARETQTQTPDNGRDITDTSYNTDGWVSDSVDAYFNSNPVAPTLVQAADDTIPSETEYLYDGDGRKTTAISYKAGTTAEQPTWQTSYIYGGDFTTTVPPAGSTATTTITDARGNTTDLLQYHTGAPADPSDPASDYSDTHYTYTPAGKQATVVDAAGNSWSYRYDLLGNQTSASDPDTGLTINTYDNDNRLLTTTDARGKQTTTQYDSDGRKTGTFDTTGGTTASAGNQIAGWTYDQTPLTSGGNAIGYPSSTVSYSGGDTYLQVIKNYTTLGLPTGTTYYLFGTDASLLPSSGLWVGHGYSPTTGNVLAQNDNANFGLPQEVLNYTYDSSNEPYVLQSSGGTSFAYVPSLEYSELGQPEHYSFFGVAGSIDLQLNYDAQTKAVTDAQTSETHSGGPKTPIDDTTYSYGNSTVSAGAGLVTSVTDTQNGGTTNGGSVDTQCFTYDYAQHLTQAWTATDACAAAPAPGSSASVGGPAPYWQSWTYDAAGDRASQTDHDTTGKTTSDTTTTYIYPIAGSSTDQPHTLTSASASGPQASQDTASFKYDASGNTTNITTGANGSGDQTLTYDDQGKLASDTTSAGTTTYVYDADSNLLIRRDPGQNTLFIADEQITQNITTSAITATRYYAIGGTTIATRTGNDVQYLIPDRQGTDELAVDASTYAVTRRQYLPFGQARGTPPTAWPGGDKGYVGGTPDPTTTLENLGAREYDSTTGRFLTPDPVFEADDPAQMGGYDYAGNNPTTASDPTGLIMTPEKGDDGITPGTDGIECYSAAQCGSSGYQNVVRSHRYNDIKYAAQHKKDFALAAYRRAHPPVVHKPPAPSCSGWLSCAFRSVTTWISDHSTIVSVVVGAACILTTPLGCTGLSLLATGLETVGSYYETGSVNWSSVAVNVGLDVLGGVGSRALSGGWLARNVAQKGFNTGLKSAFKSGATDVKDEMLGELQSAKGGAHRALTGGLHRAAVDGLETGESYAKNLAMSAGGLLMSAVQSSNSVLLSWGQGDDTSNG